jgi:hypothetical protein
MASGLSDLSVTTSAHTKQPFRSCTAYQNLVKQPWRMYLVQWSLGKDKKNTHIIHSPGCTFPTKVIRLSELGDRRSCHITDTHIECIRPTLNKVFDWNQTYLVQKNLVAIGTKPIQFFSILSIFLFPRTDLK